MRRLSLAFVAFAALASPAAAQDANLLHPIDVIERRLRDEPLVVLSARGTRTANDRTQRAVLVYPDSSTMAVKWAKAARGGAAFNNEPRYEIAAYEIQKLFLDEADYVVPPTIGRAVPTAWLRQYDEFAESTFGNAESVVLAIQYWLSYVTNENWYDRRRFEDDTVYARHLGDFNIVTYLIRHSDENSGNYLVSAAENNPRVFSVDNGVAFRSPISDRGYAWRELRVDRLPRATVERLRAITRADLDRVLGIVMHFEIKDGQLVRAEPTENLGPNRGVRRTDTAVQFGLTSAEINDVEGRLRRLLERVDQGRIKLF